MPKCKKRTPTLNYIQNHGHNMPEIETFVRFYVGKGKADWFLETHTIYKGDYVVQDEFGVFYVYEPQQFHKIFERVND